MVEVVGQLQALVELNPLAVHLLQMGSGSIVLIAGLLGLVEVCVRNLQWTLLPYGCWGESIGNSTVDRVYELGGFN